MRILYLTPYVPSPVRVRPFQLIRHLAMQGHQVTLVCLSLPNEEPEALAELRRYCYAVYEIPSSHLQSATSALMGLLGNQPLQTAYGRSPSLVRLAQHLAPLHDVVHVEHLRGASYGEALEDVPLVLDAVDCISLLFERALRQGNASLGQIRALLDLARTRRAEGRYGANYGQIVVTSPEDAWALSQLQDTSVPTPRIDVITNGVDLDHFSPDETVKRAPAQLLFSGKMSYHANEAAAFWLLQEIMPRIWRYRSDVQCVIAGRDPSANLRSLGQHPQVRVTGEVASIADYLRACTVAVAPLRYGVGIQNKVLEAMATATPVVASKQVSRALHPQAIEALELADSAESFAEHVLQLLEQPQRRSELGFAGRQYVETYHHWQQSVQQLERCYQSQIQALPNEIVVA